jgi:hypothetical protein
MQFMPCVMYWMQMMVLSQSRASGNSGDELWVESSVQPATAMRTCHPRKPVMFTNVQHGDAYWIHECLKVWKAR